MQYKITVCTPTYNRGHLLIKLYNSFKQQEFKEFQWLVVDDGSNDNTEEIIKKFIDENIIKIKYIKKANGGKHTALNVAIDNADGELFWIVDSDDYITNDSLKYIWSQWSNIKNKELYAGISGLKAYKNGIVVGTKYNDEYLDTDALSFRYKYKVQGDKA